LTLTPDIKAIEFINIDQGKSLKFDQD
jgi:hypothetical protein